MTNPFIVYGAGGLGREVRILAELLNPKREFIGFIDDGLPPNSPCDGSTILGGFDYLSNLKEKIDLFIGIADTSIKSGIFKRISDYHFISTPSLIATDSYIDKKAVIEEGCIIGHMCFISTGCKIGKGTFLNTGAQVGHDSTVGPYCSLMPSVNISGNVQVGEKVFFGVQSLILQGLKIGPQATLGAGAVAIRDIEENTIVIGNPARELKRRI